MPDRAVDSITKRRPPEPATVPSGVRTPATPTPEPAVAVPPAAGAARRQKPPKERRSRRPVRDQHGRRGRRLGWQLAAGVLLLVCLYLACAPFALRIFVPVIQQTDATEGFQYAGKAAKRAGVDMADLRPVPITNTLVIPKIGVDAPVLEGKTEAVLEKGVWRRPLSAVPGKGGNTVLTAHRFKYLSGGNTFYNLDQLQEGDSIIVFWEKQEHEYIVREKRVVGPEETGVEAATDSETLTLYTCTPLWTATKRLVVRATPR